MCLKFMDTILRQHSHERSLKIILTGYFILYTHTHTHTFSVKIQKPPKFQSLLRHVQFSKLLKLELKLHIFKI